MGVHRCKSQGQLCSSLCLHHQHLEVRQHWQQLVSQWMVLFRLMYQQERM